MSRNFQFIFFLFSIIIILCVTLQLSNGFRLRDLESGKGGTLKRKSDFRDVPFRKVQAIYRNIPKHSDEDDDDDQQVFDESDDDDNDVEIEDEDDDEDQENDDGDENDDDDEKDDDDENDDDDDKDDDDEKHDDEDDDDHEFEEKYVFEKVNRAELVMKKFAERKQKNQDAKMDTQIDEDDDEDEDSEDVKKTSVFQWLKSKRESEEYKEEPETADTDNVDDEDDKDEEEKSDEDDDNDDDQDEDEDKNDDDDQEQDEDQNDKDDDEEEEKPKKVEIPIKIKSSENKKRTEKLLPEVPPIVKRKIIEVKLPTKTIKAASEEKLKPLKHSSKPTPPQDTTPSKPLSSILPTTSDLKERTSQFLSFIKEKSDAIVNLISKDVDDDDDDDQPKTKAKKLIIFEKPDDDFLPPPKDSAAAALEELEEFDDMLLSLPSFVPNYANIVNSKCKKFGQLFQNQVKGQKHWALQMMDASAKIPAGLMLGNVNQLGDFDLCTNIATKIQIDDNKSVKMRGKYCLAQVDIKARTEEFKLPVHLMQGRSFVRSTLKDPSHFIPRFTTFNWGICLPSACTHEDVEQIITDGVKNLNASGIKITIDVPENNCYVKQRIDYAQLVKDNWEISATLIYYLFVIATVCLATMNDYWMEWKKDASEVSNESLINQILMAFSIKRTLKMLVETKNETIESIHGLKTLSTLALYFALRLIPLSRVPYTNRIYFTEYFNSSFSVLIRCAFLYTDVFLLISGILASYKMSTDVVRTGRVSWMKRYVARVIRTIPSLLAVLLFYAWIWEHTGSGPQWGDVVKQNADICKQNMWQNLLHIQNWFNFDEICATHTHQLGIEMQFYLLSPLIVWMLHSMPVLGLGAFGILHGISAAMRYSSTITNRLSPIIFHGMKLSQFYRTADLSFEAPLHRATPFFTGIGVGYILSQIGRDVKLPKGVVIAGWISSLWGIGWCLLTPSSMALKTYIYDPMEVAAYNAWASLVWSLAISWIIFACYTGHGCKLNRILGSKLMVFFSRISYSFYLIEFLVFFHRVGTIRGSQQFNSTSSLFDWSELSFLLLAAFILTITFDFPFQKIKSLLLPISTVDCDSLNTKAEEIQNDLSFHENRDDYIENIFEKKEDEDVLYYKFKQNDPISADKETESNFVREAIVPPRKVWEDDDGFQFGNDDAEEDELDEEDGEE